MNRCGWVPAGNELYEKYHDEEWGVPVWADKKIFEFLVLESAQAGLSWLTVLRKRQHYRAAFKNFSPRVVAKFTLVDVNRLLKDAGLIRNRQKIEAAVNNAKKFLAVQKEFGSFANYIWGLVDGQPIINKWEHISQLPVRTSLSDSLAVDLKKRGFKFLGSTICYAHLQATGVVNDHLVNCFRYNQLR